MANIPLLDAIDMEILMHREVHFSSSFPLMIEYYNNDDHVGIMEDFSISRMEKLHQLEENLGENLAEKTLPDPAKEEVKRAKAQYQKYRDVYETGSEIAKLLSDLILTEEKEPTNEIQALLNKKDEALQPLLDLLHVHFFYDPLFPGYGKTPIHVAKCLSMIKNQKAISPLFEAIGKGNFWIDEALIDALVSFEEAAKIFLIERLTSHPVTKTHTLAAVVLSSFPIDEEISRAAWNVLYDQHYKKDLTLSSYLIILCEGLSHQEERDAFRKFSSHLQDTHIQQEAELIIKNWR